MRAHSDAVEYDRCPPKTPPPSWSGVLPVDDQRPFRDAAHRVVDVTAGFAWAGEAGSAEEAVNLMREREPDIVIMDVRMPDMDGIEAARMLAAERPDVTVLLVSAEPLASPAADLLRSRAAAFSRKQNSGPRSCACSRGVRTRAPRAAPSPGTAAPQSLAPTRASGARRRSTWGCITR